MVVSATTDLPVAVGRMLRQARTALGLTLSQVGESMGLATSTISDIESQKRRVSAVELYKFAKLYHRPLTFFFDQDESSACFSVLLRAAEAVSVPRETIIGFQDLCKDYRDLMQLVGAPEMPGPPDYSSASPTTLEQAEDLAVAERSSMGLDSQPIKDICDLLEKKRGVKIFHLPEESQGFSGAFACDKDLGACLLINSLHPQRRRTFTVAHEYGHCIAHRNQLAHAHIDTDTGFVTRRPHERFANAFAAAFLMPRRAMNEMLSQFVSKQTTAPTAEVVFHLATYFGTSFEATGWRLVSLRKLSLSRWQGIMTQRVTTSPIAILLGYCDREDPPDMLPRHYKYLAYEAYKAKLVSFEKLAELLRRNYYELRDELSGESKEGDA